MAQHSAHLDAIEILLHEVAFAANSCPADPHASFKYDLMGDSIIWTDELPDASTIRYSKSTILRVLQRYRTTLMLGTPDVTLERYWDLGKKLFPNWPGFHSSRLQASPELVAHYEQHQRH